MKHNIPWTESPFFETELAESNLSEADKTIARNYENDGYVIIDPGIDESTIEQAKKYIAETMPGTGTNRIQDAWKQDEAIKKIAVSNNVMRILEMLYKRRPIPFQTLNFMEGSQQRTHSDMMHFSSMPERFMCGVWVALEDVNAENGPLHYYPKSHKLKFYDMLDIGVMASESKKMKNVYMDYSDYYEDFIQGVVDSQHLKKEIIDIKKGQALIWSANLLHGGEKILKQGSTRFSQVTHYYFEDCVYYTPLFSDLGLKKMYIRKITDISTGKLVPNKYLGVTVNSSLVDRVLNMLPESLANRMHRLLRK